MKTSNVFIITGKQGEGKTTKLTEVVRLLKKGKRPLFGFYATGYWENGLRSKFYINDINSGQSFLLCKRPDNLPASGNGFVFLAETIKKGEQIITEGMKHQNALAIMDEIGRYELEEKVWYSSLNHLIKTNFPVLITIRENGLAQVIEKFNMASPLIFRLDEESTQIAGQIQKQLRH